MIDKIYQDVEDKFKDNISRFNHILGVCEKAVELAKFYNLNEEKVYLAALFHDYTKYDSFEFHKSLLSIKQIEENKDYTVLYHALSASILIQTKYNINDLDIINAIKYHVFGNENMNDYAKIVFIADKTEKSRNYDDVNEIRRLSYISLNQAIIYFLESNKKYSIKMGFKIPLNVDITISALNKEKIK